MFISSSSCYFILSLQLLPLLLVTFTSKFGNFILMLVLVTHEWKNTLVMVYLSLHFFAQQNRLILPGDLTSSPFSLPSQNPSHLPAHMYSPDKPLTA